MSSRVKPGLVRSAPFLGDSRGGVLILGILVALGACNGQSEGDRSKSEKGRGDARSETVASLALGRDAAPSPPSLKEELDEEARTESNDGRTSAERQSSWAAKGEKALGNSLFPASVQGVKLRRSIVVRAEPVIGSERLGTVAAHTVVGVRDKVKASDCEDFWVAIEPKGWVCGEYLEPVERSPYGVELPALEPGRHVPGIYGKVIVEDAYTYELEGEMLVRPTPIVGASTVRKRDERVFKREMIVPPSMPSADESRGEEADTELALTTEEGEKAAGPVAPTPRLEVFWKIDGGRYIRQSALRAHEPSSFAGIPIEGPGGLGLPGGFAFSSKRPGDWVVLRDAPKGKRVRRVAPRTPLRWSKKIVDAQGNTIAYKLADGEFIDAKDLRQIKVVQPPPLLRPQERWFDVDLDAQVLVAYEGSEPVYATLVSSGTRRNETETGIFRIWIKFAETSMSGRMGEEDAYSVATVPWTQFYENDFALHTSYWHDRFGQQRSHGCVNLSPADARFLYFWSAPSVPPGWSMANSSSLEPGSIVRVHSEKDPDPQFKGRALDEQKRREEEANIEV